MDTCREDCAWREAEGSSGLVVRFGTTSLTELSVDSPASIDVVIGSTGAVTATCFLDFERGGP